MMKVDVAVVSVCLEREFVSVDGGPLLLSANEEASKSL